MTTQKTTKTTYNIEITCCKCPNTFIKTPTTGNICHTCRWKNRSLKRKAKTIKIYKATQFEKEQIMKFIEEMKRKQFLTNLFEINDLITYSEMIGVTAHGLGDNVATGKQLARMWKGLLDWYSLNKNKEN